MSFATNYLGEIIFVNCLSIDENHIYIYTCFDQIWIPLFDRAFSSYKTANEQDGRDGS